MELIEQLNWRYATKRMTGEKIPPEKLDKILEAIRLSASSFGLQPYRILVIDDLATRKKLQPAAHNQPQIVEASQLLVFASWDSVSPAQIHEFIALTAAERGVTEESLAHYEVYIGGALAGKTPEQIFTWTARQAYIALGTGLVAAASEHIDATPMEGFDGPAFDEILGLKEKGLRSAVIMALGYRDTATDYLAKAKKVRTRKENLFITV